ncbi:receptor-like kinase4 [Zea mays]|jgi:hypothetical protein|uniref:Receptor-like kinase4 n=1 Tax=Zea mays TaxID=4577 RepID=A0A1D6FD45_MAIZE|nr:receptor-like kinase4 [Zea mays]AQK89937.1 receptor-like kinase4 [Zea mays]AQK89938.1 receptor-like kinase4 [Zea mays]AQK89946.1 receptor-like kinase4 [Zea mays]
MSTDKSKEHICSLWIDADCLDCCSCNPQRQKHRRNSRNTKFWKDKWLNGKRIKDLALSLYNFIPKRIVNSRTIYEAITDRKWISDIKGPLTVGVLTDYLQLWNMTSAWQLQPEVKDKHVFSIAPTGIYSAKTAYEGFFLGSVVFPHQKKIWKTWALPKCRFFIWLVAQNRVWTTDRLAKRGLIHPEKCPLCDQEDETIDYLLVTCCFSRELVSVVKEIRSAFFGSSTRC